MHLARFLVIYTGPELGPEKIIILARLLIYRTFIYQGLTVYLTIYYLPPFNGFLYFQNDPSQRLGLDTYSSSSSDSYTFEIRN